MPYLPRGLGRSYGDACLPAPGHVSLSTARLKRMLSFNPTSGVLDAEGGVTLAEILDVAVPRGYFLPVTPGTRWVTLGGAIASNVHGKNHHGSGSLEHFLLELEVATPEGVFVCSPQANPDLFRATVGGYGLTGLITRAKVRMKVVASTQVECLRVRAKGLEDLFRLFDTHDGDFEYSVAWLDTLARGRGMGRGVLMLGNHAGAGKIVKVAETVRSQGETMRSMDPPVESMGKARAAVSVPFPMPGFLLNRFFLSAFNGLFYGVSGGSRRSVEAYPGFFYPLDRIGAWNLLYGRKGFFQYQCVIPDGEDAGSVGNRNVSERGIEAVLAFLSDHGLGAFLSVLKRCGDDQVMLPFCKKGYTLALDIPYRSGETLRLLDRLDELVLRHGGRVYLTKDARLSPSAFRAMYPEWRGWMETVRKYNPEARVDSAMARRLGLWDA